MTCMFDLKHKRAPLYNGSFPKRMRQRVETRRVPEWEKNPERGYAVLLTTFGDGFDFDDSSS